MRLVVYSPGMGMSNTVLPADGRWHYISKTITHDASYSLTDISVNLLLAAGATVELNGAALTPGSTPLANESYQNSAALKNKTIDTGTVRFNTAIEYDTDKNHTAYSRVKHYINNGKAISYSYDTAGNISSIQNPDGSYVEYIYDDLNQLIGEHYSATVGDGSPVPYDTVSYEYDDRGNLLSKVYSLNGETVDTVTYSYTDTVWKDRLTSFDGTSISYDQIGNPLNWTNGATLSWQHGRQLASYSKDDTTISYAYDADGIRTAKTVNGVKTTYTVTDGTLRRMTSGDNTLEFINGTSVIFNGTEYWYVFNAQNDVIGIIDASGNYVVEYTYDAWGNPLSKTGSLTDTLGTLNPFRYRGYIYDEETGLYYVSSRYYDPEIGRFLNADNEALVTATPEVPHWDKNLYAYCDNNPVIRYDIGGNIWDFLDFISFGYSLGEALSNPGDWEAWVNVVADGVDLLPGVTGVGEITRSARIANTAVEVVDTALDANRVADSVADVGFNSFGALKKYLGSPGQGKHWHHIVEQCQVTKSGFAMDTIQNTHNIIAVDASTHYLITAYYNRKHHFTEGKSFREWLTGKSFEEQYQEGMRVLKEFGVI